MENKVYFFNTLTRKVEQFIPNVDGKVAMYTCCLLYTSDAADEL